MTRLSVNVNKIATLRNARGGNNPDLLKVAADCERFGAQGITVHPRPDERHVRYADVIALSKQVETEFNIEGYPDKRYMEIIRETRPHQATLVPDPPEVLTSNAGWDTLKNKEFLKDIIAEIKGLGVRSSIFIGTDLEMIRGAAETGTDRVELYTEPYAQEYKTDRKAAVAPFVRAAEQALKVGLQLNAGHDLDLENLRYFSEQVPGLEEVSIGHALVCDALYLGLENTIRLYRRELE